MSLNRATLVAVLAGGILLTGTWVIGQALSEGLPVSKFPELPKEVASDLVRRGCTIVPDRARRDGRNVLHGDFARAGQTDWAVLCRRGDQASLVVYWAGKAENPDVLNTTSSGLGKDPEAARTIGVVGRDRLQRYATRHAELTNSEMKLQFSHAGIEDAVGMGSEILYYLDGKWLRIPGAD
jgi:hypothetical protein